MAVTGILKHIVQINDFRSVLDQGMTGNSPTELKANQLGIALGATGPSPIYRLMFRDSLGNAHDVANMTDIGEGPTGMSGVTGTVGVTGFKGVTGSQGLTGLAGGSVGNINLSFGITGTVISTGIKADVTLPFNLEFTSWRVVGQPTGSVLFTLTSYSYTNYPYTGNMIPGYTGPYINGDFKNQATSLVGWTGSAGDVLEISIDSCSSFSNLSLSLGYSKV